MAITTNVEILKTGLKQDYKKAYVDKIPDKIGPPGKKTSLKDYKKKAQKETEQLSNDIAETISKVIDRSLIIINNELDLLNEQILELQDVTTNSFDSTSISLRIDSLETRVSVIENNLTNVYGFYNTGKSVEYISNTGIRQLKNTIQDAIDNADLLGGYVEVYDKGTPYTESLILKNCNIKLNNGVILDSGTDFVLSSDGTDNYSCKIYGEGASIIQTNSNNSAIYLNNPNLNLEINVKEISNIGNLQILPVSSCINISDVNDLVINCKEKIESENFCGVWIDCVGNVKIKNTNIIGNISGYGSLTVGYVKNCNVKLINTIITNLSDSTSNDNYGIYIANDSSSFLLDSVGIEVNNSNSIYGEGSPNIKVGRPIWVNNDWGANVNVGIENRIIF